MKNTVEMATTDGGVTTIDLRDVSVIIQRSDELTELRFDNKRDSTADTCTVRVGYEDVQQLLREVKTPGGAKR
jgi:hypothetical protein